ncbi:dethiobiotin synthase [Porphyromonas levii]|uniref:dethiobiotin synthase n=1 Tax=Porphyromonas levii TaxID=28114 RepID=UPI001BAD5528|nr:dethiobiotin synthase [Porphyromonas levii]MBR8703097.1 ATP-dependent dethiobiotin synthetase BioD [Porphyromonas levii]
MKLSEILTAPVHFVSGIDTDAGKSIATGWLSRQLLSEGVNVITQKLVQTGCIEMSDDILTHRKIEGRELLPEDIDHTTHPILYAKPASPHIAAELEGTTVDISLATQSTAQLIGKYEKVLLEGAGGLMVPITRDLLTLEYVAGQKLPVILVTTAQLGSINHTLLSLEAIASRGLEIPLVVYNEGLTYDPIVTEDSREYLRTYLATNYPTTHFLVLPRIELV